MNNWFKKLSGATKREQKIAEEQRALEDEICAIRAELDQKIQKTKDEENMSLKEQQLSAFAQQKQQATANGEPWVAVLDTQVNPKSIKNGFFELDWNNEFIERLLDEGYKGESQEAIVDAWFRTVIVQMLEEEGVDVAREMGHINVAPLANGKSEVS